MKRVRLFIVAAILLSISFAAGKFWEHLSDGLGKEANYPWDIHRQIANTKLDCEKLRTKNATGYVFTEVLEGGKIALITSYNTATQMVTVSAIDARHRVATDTWQLQCSVEDGGGK